MKKKKAFSIIEVLIAIFIIEIGILGLSAFFASSFKAIRFARSETIASNLASGLLDEKLSTSYSGLAVGAGVKERYTSTPTDPFYNYYKKIDISYIDTNLANSGADVGLKKVVVTIYWTDTSGEKNFQTASIKSIH